MAKYVPRSKVFWSLATTASLATAAVLYDRHRADLIRKRYAEQADILGALPLSVGQAPRKITLLLHGNDTAAIRHQRAVFRSSVVQLLTRAGCDYQLVEFNSAQLCSSGGGGSGSGSGSSGGGGSGGGDGGVVGSSSSSSGSGGGGNTNGNPNNNTNDNTNNNTNDNTNSITAMAAVKRLVKRWAYDINGNTGRHTPPSTPTTTPTTAPTTATAYEAAVDLLSQSVPHSHETFTQGLVATSQDVLAGTLAGIGEWCAEEPSTYVPSTSSTGWLLSWIFPSSSSSSAAKTPHILPSLGYICLDHPQDWKSRLVNITSPCPHCTQLACRYNEQKLTHARTHRQFFCTAKLEEEMGEATLRILCERPATVELDAVMPGCKDVQIKAALQPFASVKVSMYK